MTVTTAQRRDEARQHALALLDIREADAWREYVETCRAAVEYDQVEPWAWTRLERRLATIAGHRATLEPGKATA